jgi:chitinase
MRLRRWLVVAGTLAVALTGVAAPVNASAAGTATEARLPAHLFTPYFEAYTTENPWQLSHESGAKYLTLAFLQTPSPGSCTITWNGDTSTPVAWSTYGADIAEIRDAGGDVVPSFGGYSADHGGTDIADSCTSVPEIAAAYERVVTTYNVTRLDLDVEDRSLTDKPGIDRRNRAIAMVEAWAAGVQRIVQFVYTIPTNVAGLDPTAVHVLRNAVLHDARIDIVNIMTFDYYDGLPHEMADDTETAAGHLYDTLEKLYPQLKPAAVWGMIGVTEMIGIDDYGPPEILTLPEARVVEAWARTEGIAELSYWALQRDNGGCPGVAGSDSCSGLHQPTWAFTHIFSSFTHAWSATSGPTKAWNGAAI